MKLTQTVARLAPLAIFLLLGACTLFPPEATIDLTLPEPPDLLPENWVPERLVWELDWYAEGRTDTLRLPADAGGCRISVRAGWQALVPVTVRLVNTGTGRSSLPAGAVANLGQEFPVQLSWYGGFLAELVIRLAEYGIPPDLVNVERTRQEIRWRLPENPWKADMERIAGKFLEHSMRASYFRAETEIQVRLSVPAGTYVGRNFLESPLSTVPVNETHEISVAVIPGRRDLWWSKDGEYELSLWCGPDGRCSHHLRRLSTEPRHSPACQVRK